MENSINQIKFSQYCKMLEIAKDKFKTVSLNVSKPNDTKGNKYFQSLEGCSILTIKGELCGLFRFKKGTEKVAKIHQFHRINLGGYWLNCYRGKLDKIYKSQGFKVISAIEFNPEFAPIGWKNDEILKNQPDIFFMVLNKFHTKNHFTLCENYERAEQIAVWGIL